MTTMDAVPREASQKIEAVAKSMQLQLRGLNSLNANRMIALFKALHG
jgi:hypothetical protein